MGVPGTEEGQKVSSKKESIHSVPEQKKDRDRERDVRRSKRRERRSSSRGGDKRNGRKERANDHAPTSSLTSTPPPMVSTLASTGSKTDKSSPLVSHRRTRHREGVATSSKARRSRETMDRSEDEDDASEEYRKGKAVAPFSLSLDLGSLTTPDCIPSDSAVFHQGRTSTNRDASHDTGPDGFAACAPVPIPRPAPAFSIRSIPAGANPTPRSSTSSSSIFALSARRDSVSSSGGGGALGGAAAVAAMAAATPRAQEMEAELQALEARFAAELTEERLQTMTGCEDLREVRSLELVLDTSVTSGEALGELLPSLQHLRLLSSPPPTSTEQGQGSSSNSSSSSSHGSGSRLSCGSLRDLGTCLRHLTVLWAPRVGLSCVEGVAALPCLTELYIAFNDVEDLSPLALHDQLQVLDCDSNRLEEPLLCIEPLATCPSLLQLTLTANPIARRAQYRSRVLRALPPLEYLDDEPVSTEERRAATAAAAAAAAAAAQGGEADEWGSGGEEGGEGGGGCELGGLGRSGEGGEEDGRRGGGGGSFRGGGGGGARAE